MPKDFILYALFWRAFLFSSKSLPNFTAQQGDLTIILSSSNYISKTFQPSKSLPGHQAYISFISLKIQNQF